MVFVGLVHTHTGASAEVVESGAPEWRRSGVQDNDDMEEIGSHRDPVVSGSPNKTLKHTELTCIRVLRLWRLASKPLDHDERPPGLIIQISSTMALSPIEFVNLNF